MSMNLVRPGMAPALSAPSLLEGGVDELVTGWAHPYSASDPFKPWHADGGESEADDEDEGDEDEEDTSKEGEEDDDADEDEDAGKTPEELAAEVKRLRAAYLKKLRQGKNRSVRIQALESDKTAYDKKLAELETELKGLREAGGASGEVDNAAQQRINDLIDAAKEEGKNSFKPVVIRMAARSELMAAGARATVVDRLVKMVDTDDVDIDDEDGSIDLTDQVLQLKKELPELFGPVRARTKTKAKPSAESAAKAKAAGGGDGGDEGAKDVVKTATQRAADKLRGIK